MSDQQKNANSRQGRIGPGILGTNPDRAVTMIGLSGWFHQVLYGTLDILPPPLRWLAFKLLLKSYGRASWVDYGCFLRYPWAVSIGAGTIVNHGCRFYGSFHVPGITIAIGDDCAIAPGVTVYTAGHDYKTLELKDTAASVKIGSNVWVGGNATILPGVTIGDGAVIGAGAVVSADVPPWTVALGVPARVVAERKIGSSAQEALVEAVAR